MSECVGVCMCMLATMWTDTFTGRFPLAGPVQYTLHKAARRPRSTRRQTQTVRLRGRDSDKRFRVVCGADPGCFGTLCPVAEVVFGRREARPGRPRGGCPARSVDLYFALPCPSSTQPGPRPASSKQSAGLANTTLLSGLPRPNLLCLSSHQLDH